MYYEYKCRECGYEFTINLPMEKAAIAIGCIECLGKTDRVFSAPQINMNKMVGEGLTRTNEPPDELKPGIERNIKEREQGILKSYPGKPAKRLPCFE